MANDRHDEALQVLIKYHGDDDPNNAIVKLSYAEMKEVISLEGSDKRWWDYSELVKTRSSRWRLTMVISMAFFGRKWIPSFKPENCAKFFYRVVW
jgi:hypothetical protein